MAPETVSANEGAKGSAFPQRHRPDCQSKGELKFPSSNFKDCDLLNVINEPLTDISNPYLS